MKARSGDIASNTIREPVKERDDDHRCLYHGRAVDLALAAATANRGAVAE